MNNFLIALFILSSYYACVLSHGYLAEPPARSSAWLFDKDFEECCTNYNHMQMFCGGTNTLWLTYGGQCGICGEVWNATKQFEKGGDKYLGKIVRTYKQGDVMNVSVIITANHYGYFEFRICNVDGWENEATQECLNQTVLNISNTSNTRIYVKKYSSPANIQYQLQLPQNLTCNRCVLQWKYVGGNRWGTDDVTNQSCIGCGVIQEHFYGCADISVLPPSLMLTKKPLPQTTLEALKRPQLTAPKQTQNKTQSKSQNSTQNITQNKIQNATQNTTVDDDSYDGCKSKLKFDNEFNLAKSIAIFCSRFCKTKCFGKTDPKLVNDEVCLNTCPVVCSCDNEQLLKKDIMKRLIKKSLNF